MSRRPPVQLLAALPILTLFTVATPATGSDREARICPSQAEASEQAGVVRLAAAVGLPEPREMAPCNASLDCGDGNTISCTGDWSCEADEWNGYVECDGSRTTCPNRCEIWQSCCGGSTGCRITCSSNAGNCQQGSGWVQCDGGLTITCDICSFLCS